MLKDIDLNLLRSLAALLDEVHVTRAAERLGVTQSAVSHSLAKLRQHFDDPLLSKEKQNFQLTPLGQCLHQQLQTLLPQIEAIFTAQHFDPYSHNHQFSLLVCERPLYKILCQWAIQLMQQHPLISVDIAQLCEPPALWPPQAQIYIGTEPVTDTDHAQPLQTQPQVQFYPQNVQPQDTTPLLLCPAAGSNQQQLTNAQPYHQFHSETLWLYALQQGQGQAICSQQYYQRWIAAHPQLAGTFVSELTSNQPVQSLFWPATHHFDHAHQWLRQHLQQWWQSQNLAKTSAGDLSHECHN